MKMGTFFIPTGPNDDRSILFPGFCIDELLQLAKFSLTIQIQEGSNNKSSKWRIYWFYTSRLATVFARDWMKCLRGGTSSPMSIRNTSSARSASSTVTRNIFRCTGSIVVSQSCSGFISPRPLYRCTPSVVIPSSAIVCTFCSSLYTYQTCFHFDSL